MYFFSYLQHENTFPERKVGHIRCLLLNCVLLTSCVTCIWSCVSVTFQKSNLMFKRLDASTLPEDILSNTQPLPMMAHSAGSALWVCKCVKNSVCVCVCVYVCMYAHLCLCLLTVYLYPLCRTRGGFVALSPISPQELFLQPISSDNDASQQQNLVRQWTKLIKHKYHNCTFYYRFNRLIFIKTFFLGKCFWNVTSMVSRPPGWESVLKQRFLLKYLKAL